MNPDISVYMTAFNAEAFIHECIESVLSQSFSNFEFIIVDDGSTDGTIEIIKDFKDKRIRLFEREHGYIDSLNFSVNISDGYYLAKMDADDIMMVDRLLIQYNYLESNKEIDVLAGGIQFFGNKKDYYIPLIVEENISLYHFEENNIIAHPTVMIRKSSISEFLPNLYEKEFAYSEDYKLWLDLIKAGLRIDLIPDILVRYRSSPNQVTVQKSLEIHEKLSIIKDSYFSETINAK